MNKKIMVLNGSPRPKGNTAALVREFTAGAEQAGNTVTTFLLDTMNINGCKGCFAGGKDPDHPCVQRDDMERIYPVYRDCDVVVLASPLYYWTISGQLRVAFDRLVALAEFTANFQNPSKDCVLLMAAAGDGYDETVYYYNGLMKHIGWNSLGMVLATGVGGIGDIEGKPFLKEAYTLGASIS